MKILYILLCLFITPSLSSLEMRSGDFRNRGYLPSYLSCEGKNISPSLHIDKVPQSCKSLALIMEDGKGQVHWVLYNLPPHAQHIPRGKAAGETGYNYKRQKAYLGPCQNHSYTFTLYALDALLPVAGRVNARSLKQWMRGHVIKKATLVGYFQKKTSTP